MALSSVHAIVVDDKADAQQLPTVEDTAERRVIIIVNKIIDPVVGSLQHKNDLISSDRIDQTAKNIKAAFQQQLPKMPSDVDIDLCMRILATDTIANCDLHRTHTPDDVANGDGGESDLLFVRLAFIISLTQKLPEYGIGLPSMNYFVLQTIVDQVDPPFFQKLFPLVLESCSRDAIRAYLKRCNQDTKDAFDRHCNNMLRFFNDILRRTQHAAFAGLRGEVRIAIDRMLGFGHQSGLHLLDEFSMPAHHFKSNVVIDDKSKTASSTTASKSTSAAESTTGDGAASIDTSKVSVATEIDTTRKFESEAFEAKIQFIRRCFCDSKAISSTLTWRQFSQEWEETLKKFRDNPIDDTNSFRMWPTPPHEYTSERVLTDNRARLLLCFQFIIYADFWLYTNSAEHASSASNTAAANKTKPPAKSSAYALNEDQKAWFRDQSSACYDLIDTYGRRIELPQGGIGASSSIPTTLPVKQLMQMEAAWNEWKAERGKTVWTRPPSTAGLLPIPESVTLAAENSTAPNQSAVSIRPPKVRIDGALGSTSKTVTPNNFIRLLRASKSSQTVRVGPDYLNRLWNLRPKNKEEFKEANYFEPGLEYLVGVLEEADPAAEMEDKYKTVHDANFQFRALRILRKHCSSFINPNTVVQNVGNYLEEIVTKKIRDKIVAEAKEKGIKVNAPTLLASTAPTQASVPVALNKQPVVNGISNPSPVVAASDGASTTGISDAEDDADEQLDGIGNEDLTGGSNNAEIDDAENDASKDTSAIVDAAANSLPSAPSTPKRAVDESDAEDNGPKRAKVA